MSSYCNQIRNHYQQHWGTSAVEHRWDRGPVEQLPDGFSILEFAPQPTRAWTYCTCCMSRPQDAEPIELHLLSPIESLQQVELLTVIAHYHRTGERLGLGHTVNFGRPWLENSLCTYGLLSRPYLDGPMLEQKVCPPAKAAVQFLWLLPITAAERNYKRQRGLEALESRLQEAYVNYLDPQRASVV